MSAASSAVAQAGPLTVTKLDRDDARIGPRGGSLSHTTAAAIIERLGFEPDYHSVEGVTDEEWRFEVNGHVCAIWDHRGSGRRFGMWSTYGPPEVFLALFGWRAVT